MGNQSVAHSQAKNGSPHHMRESRESYDDQNRLAEPYGQRDAAGRYGYGSGSDAQHEALPSAFNSKALDAQDRQRKNESSSETNDIVKGNSDHCAASESFPDHSEESVPRLSHHQKCCDHHNIHQDSS